MIERPIITELFEKIAVDVVGPLPKGKGGAEHILTILCVASRWPEAIPLRKIMARARCQEKLCKLLQIERVRTTAYHPQTNGMVEWFHGTFESMLTKAVDLGLDWVGQTFLLLYLL